MDTKRTHNTVEVTLYPEDVLHLVRRCAIDFAKDEFDIWEYTENWRCATDEEKPFVVKVTADVSVDQDMKRRSND